MLNELTRSCRIPFVWAILTSGNLSLFVDPFPLDALAFNPKGFCHDTSSSVVTVGYVTKNDPRIVTTPTAHGLQSGDSIGIGEGRYLAEPVSRDTFQVLLASKPTTDEETGASKSKIPPQPIEPGMAVRRLRGCTFITTDWVSLV